MKYFSSLKYTVASAMVLLLSCTDPVEPEFRNIGGLIYIDAQVSTSVGASYAKVFESNTDFRLFRNILQTGATVIFRNMDTDEAIVLSEEEDSYVPPMDFKAEVGETWQLDITLEDGRTYISEPETVSTPIPMEEITAVYQKELYYREDVEGFIPGHDIRLRFNEPGETDNYYLWGYRSFEKPRYCEVCYDGIYRNGECIPENSAFGFYYTYACNTQDCFQIRYHEKIELLSDEFVNGLLVDDLVVAQVPLYQKGNILVELQQYSISAEAYAYFKVLKDIVDNNAGFNAPPPAALIGNLFNPNNSDEFVLGRFTALGTTTQSVFIDRSNIVANAIEPILPSNSETGLGAVTTAPCVESRYRTATEPDGWVD